MPKLIKYIFYKLSNNLYGFFYLKKRYPLLSYFGDIRLTSKIIYFDLTHETTHLGDRLFFLPLMHHLLENGYQIIVSEGDNITCTLFGLIYSIRLRTATSSSNFENIFIPKPSFFANRRKYKKCFVIDFADISSNHKITEQSILSVRKTINSASPAGGFKFDIGVIKGIDQLDSSKKYYIFSNYINSGSFRKFFIDESKLIKKAIELKSGGYSIIHVGSKYDKEQDQNNYPFVDIDLRGIVSIETLITLCHLPNVYGAITYDNFLMHLMGIFGKKAIVLFRGRFLKKNSIHHFLHVNNTFFLNEKDIVYL